MTPLIRAYAAADAPALGAVFFRAVREGAALRYSEDQCRAWAPAPPDGPAWAARLGRQTVFVAETGGRPVGFMTCDADGYVDLAFVAPEWMGKGLAGALYAALEAEARVQGIARLTVAASHMARRFFLSRGWTERSAQEVTCNGVALQNFRMCKSLC